MLNVVLRRSSPAALHAPMTHPTTALRGVQGECANPQCGRRWTAFLKDRRRPLFEGSWSCSGQCATALVVSAIRREMPEAGGADVEQHRHRVPLGLILLAKGWITQSQLRHALDAQQRAGVHPLGQWLIEECGIPQQHIARGLGMQWGCPVLTMEGFDPETMVLAMPKLLIEALGIVPIRIARDRVLYLGCVGQPDPAAALAIERMSGLKVVSGLIDSAQQKSAQQRLSVCACVDAAFEHAPDFESMSRRIASTLVTAQPRASCLVRVHQFFWLRMWLEAGSMSTPTGGFLRTREDVADRIFTLGSEQ
jgi:hypothetical protein